ncbi:TlpA family protein disulfide reductase [Fulvivirgaceae bacterium PWU5]|uniref:TlpA family protein disulfide reductase n=1 Tax=Dawidia cretensis TaxID=2782350 RepID=A0AAP2GWP2_9BACT|nr:TlpA disulfide reductase family protein [Dawidia cretensis]MBT1711027.1 TlpA family protein disulfide reductase [Dawidia cretensis]
MELTGFKDGTWFHLVNLDLGKATDSLQLKNGRGVFKGTVKEPAGCRIHTIDNKYLIIELDNSYLKVKGSYQDFGYATITGSALNRTWTKSRDHQKLWQAERDTLMRRFVRFMDTDPAAAKEAFGQMRKIDDQIKQYRLSLIRTERPSYFTIRELFFLRNDLPADTLKALFDLFPPALRQTRYGVVVATYLDAEKVPVIGDRFVDIEGTDTQGNVRKLSDNLGKYVLLEFWASWCGPCVNEIPNLKTAYDAFSSRGFEVYSFSIDASSEAWRKSLQKHRTPWINVSDTQGSYSVMAARYGVRAIPKNYLINPDGVVVGIDLRGNDLYSKLEALIK